MPSSKSSGDRLPHAFQAGDENGFLPEVHYETVCVLEVVTGRADAFIYDELSIAKHQQENPKSTYALLKPFTYEPFAMAIRKGDFDFLNWLERRMSRMG